MTEFWREKRLQDMSPAEFEAVCDGCARCCMVKLEDEDTDEVFYTAMVCDLLETDSCRCSRYQQRHELVPDCVVLTAERASSFHWLPQSCAYRTLAEGRELQWWHPLVSGSPDTVHEAGISVRDKVVPESSVHVDAYESMLVTWVEH